MCQTDSEMTEGTFWLSTHYSVVVFALSLEKVGSVRSDCLQQQKRSEVCQDSTVVLSKRQRRLVLVSARRGKGTKDWALTLFIAVENNAISLLACAHAIVNGELKKRNSQSPVIISKNKMCPLPPVCIALPIRYTEAIKSIHPLWKLSCILNK